MKDEQNKKGSGPERKRNEPRDTAPDAEQILPQMPNHSIELIPKIFQNQQSLQKL